MLSKMSTFMGISTVMVVTLHGTVVLASARWSHPTIVVFRRPLDTSKYLSLTRYLKKGCEAACGEMYKSEARMTGQQRMSSDER